MRSNDLIAALTARRTNDVTILFGRTRLPLLDVKYDPDTARTLTGDDDAMGGSDEIHLIAGHSDIWTLTPRYSPDDDEAGEMLMAAVGQLRGLWEAHTATGRNTPDFYHWATTLLVTLYEGAHLRSALPIDADPNGTCRCSFITSLSHRPGEHPRCRYSREYRERIN